MFGVAGLEPATLIAYMELKLYHWATLRCTVAITTSVAPLGKQPL